MADAQTPEDADATPVRWSWMLVAIGLGALALRVAYTLVVTRSGDLGLEGDAFSYSVVAGELGPGRWFVDPFTGRQIADHPPLTSLVLAPVSALSGSVVAQRLTMAVIGSIAVVVIGLVGRSVAGRRAGLAAAAVAALNPNLWINDGLVMSESISTLLIALVLLAGLALARRPTLTTAAVTGGVCGLAVLARPEVGLFVPLMVLPILASAPSLDWSARLGRMGLAVACTLAVLVPWAAWNTSRFEQPVLISTNDGTVLAGANCPDTYYGSGIGGWSLDCVAEVNAGAPGEGDLASQGLDASQVSARQRTAAFSYIQDHLTRTPLVVLAREGRAIGIWQPSQMVEANTAEGRRAWASWLCFVAFWALVPTSIIGARRLRRDGVTLVPFVACLVSAVVVVALTHGLPRLRLPLDIAMCVLTGVAVAWWAARRSSRTARPAGSTIKDLYDHA